MDKVFAGIGLLILYFVYLVMCIGLFVGAVYVVFKIFGIDVEGFTA